MKVILDQGLFIHELTSEDLSLLSARILYKNQVYRDRNAQTGWQNNFETV